MQKTVITKKFYKKFELQSRAVRNPALPQKNERVLTQVS